MLLKSTLEEKSPVNKQNYQDLDRVILMSILNKDLLRFILISKNDSQICASFKVAFHIFTSHMHFVEQRMDLKKVEIVIC